MKGNPGINAEKWDKRADRYRPVVGAPPPELVPDVEPEPVPTFTRHVDLSPAEAQKIADRANVDIAETGGMSPKTLHDLGFRTPKMNRAARRRAKWTTKTDGDGNEHRVPE